MCTKFISERTAGRRSELVNCCSPLAPLSASLGFYCIFSTKIRSHSHTGTGSVSSALVPLNRDGRRRERFHPDTQFKILKMLFGQKYKCYQKANNSKSNTEEEENLIKYLNYCGAFAALS